MRLHRIGRVSITLSSTNKIAFMAQLDERCSLLRRWLRVRVPLKAQSLFLKIKFGVLVKLVIMPPCHGGAHGFESRTHRKQSKVIA